jgi:hypothetical protein
MKVWLFIDPGKGNILTNMNYYIYGIKRKFKEEILYVGKRQTKCDPELDHYMGSSRILLGYKRRDGFIYPGVYKTDGIEHFEKIILEKDIISLKELNEKEKFYIKFYKEKNEARYNIAKGGDGGDTGIYTRTLEQRQKMSIAQKGRIVTEEHRQKIRDTLKRKYASGELVNSMLGKSSWENVSPEKIEERKRKMSEKMSGKNNPMFGRPNGHQGEPRSEETKRKISETEKKTKRKLKDFAEKDVLHDL